MRRGILIAAAMLAAVLVAAQARPRAYSIGQTEQVTRGLVAYWSMRNSGTTVYDEIGVNNGLASNGVAFAYGNGAVGDGASFDGTNDYISVNDSALLDNTIKSAFSVSFWYNRVGATATWQFLIGKGNAGASGGGFGIFVDNTASNKMDVQMFNSGGGTAYISRNGLGIGSGFNHYVIVFDGSKSTQAQRLTVYINGVQTSGTYDDFGTLTECSANTYPLTFCERSSAAGRPAKALLDEVRLYNRALTDYEIKQLYRMGATIYNNR